MVTVGMRLCVYQSIYIQHEQLHENIAPITYKWCRQFLVKALVLIPCNLYRAVIMGKMCAYYLDPVFYVFPEYFLNAIIVI